MAGSLETYPIDFEFIEEEAEVEVETVLTEFDFRDGSLATFLYQLYREDPDGQELSIQIWSEKISPHLSNLSQVELEEFQELFREFCREFIEEDEQIFSEELLSSEEIKQIVIFFERFVEFASENSDQTNLAKTFLDEFETLETRINNNNIDIDHEEAYKILRRVIIRDFGVKPKKHKPKKISRKKDVVEKQLEGQELSCSIGELRLYSNCILEYKDKKVKVTQLMYRFILLCLKHPNRRIMASELVSAVLNIPENTISSTQMNYVSSWRKTFYRKMSALGIDPAVLSHKPRAGYVFLSSYITSPDNITENFELNTNSKHKLITNVDNQELTYRFGSLTLCHQSSTGWILEYSGEFTNLGQIEASLLLYFIKNPDTDLTAEKLLSECWHEKPGSEVKASKVVTMVGKLRRNLVQIGLKTNVIVPTEKSGYRFDSWQVK